MKPEYLYLPSFVSSTRHTLEEMASTRCVHSSPESSLKGESWGDITGVIPIESDSIKGTMVLSFEGECAISLASRMLDEKFESITAEVIDAVDELTNIISGGFKNQLNGDGHSFELALPRVVKGKGVEIPELGENFLTLPFNTDAGSFVIQAIFDSKEG